MEGILNILDRSLSTPREMLQSLHPYSMLNEIHDHQFMDGQVDSEEDQGMRKEHYRA